MNTKQVATGLRHFIAGARLIVERQLSDEMQISEPRETDVSEVDDALYVDDRTTLDFSIGEKKFRAIILAMTLVLACASVARAQHDIGAYRPDATRPLWHFNPYISNPVERLEKAFMDAEATRIIREHTSRAVVVQAVAGSSDMPFVFVNLTNTDTTSMDVLLIYRISGKDGKFDAMIHTRTVAPMGRLSLGLHTEPWTFGGEEIGGQALNMSVMVYFVGNGAMEMSWYRPSPIAGRPPVEVLSKVAQFLPRAGDGQ